MIPTEVICAIHSRSNIDSRRRIEKSLKWRPLVYKLNIPSHLKKFRFKNIQVDLASATETAFAYVPSFDTYFIYFKTNSTTRLLWRRLRIHGITKQTTEVTDYYTDDAHDIHYQTVQKTINLPDEWKQFHIDTEYADDIFDDYYDTSANEITDDEHYYYDDDGYDDYIYFNEYFEPDYDFDELDLGLDFDEDGFDYE
jgi:hypothetical protein